MSAEPTDDREFALWKSNPSVNNYQVYSLDRRGTYNFAVHEQRVETDDRVEDPESPPLFLAGYVDLDLLDVAHDLLLDPTMDFLAAIEDRLALDGSGGVDLDDGAGGRGDCCGALERRQEGFRSKAIRMLNLCSVYGSAS